MTRNLATSCVFEIGSLIPYKVRFSPECIVTYLVAKCFIEREGLVDVIGLRTSDEIVRFINSLEGSEALPRCIRVKKGLVSLLALFQME